MLVLSQDGCILHDMENGDIKINKEYLNKDSQLCSIQSIDATEIFVERTPTDIMGYFVKEDAAKSILLRICKAANIGKKTFEIFDTEPGAVSCVSKIAKIKFDKANE